MPYLTSILNDLREKRLWPLALVLLVALVAVPVLLSRPAKPAPVPGALSATPPPSSATAVPAVSVSGGPASGHLKGPARDPFTQQQQAALKSVTATAATNPTGTGTTSTLPGTGVTGSTLPSGGSGFTQGAPLPGGSTPPSTPSSPPSTPQPAPGLSSTEAYEVALAITNSSGGLDTIDPLERLSVLPRSRPLLVELGVLNGGHRVLFAVQPYAVVSGGGSCTPGPIDCEVLSLAPGQLETVSVRSDGGPQAVAMFTVAAIRTHKYASAAAAAKARRAASAAGRQLLAGMTSPALSLFQYRPSLGTVVDLRNLTVGGS